MLGELESNANDCKKFWKVIRQVIPSDKQQARHDILLKDNDLKVGKDEVAGFINDYFINVGNTGKHQINGNGNSDEVTDDHEDDIRDEITQHNDSLPKLENFNKLHEVNVLRVIKDINVSKSSGLNNISSFIVKEVFLAIIPEITHLFNLSLETSVFPAEWKKAMIVPIPKTGDLTLVQNYRPISLLPLPGKILEKLVHTELAHHLESNSLLTNDQHGFRRGHSTIHSVAQLTNFVNMKLDAGLPIIATYLDFRKAFDCVQHPTLLDKLAKMNLGDSIIEWVRSYLSLRMQRVFANNTFSSYMTIQQGVPQGSVLGPLFYIVYANDLVNIIKHCKVALYADDTGRFHEKRAIFGISGRKNIKIEK